MLEHTSTYEHYMFDLFYTFYKYKCWIRWDVFFCVCLYFLSLSTHFLVDYSISSFVYVWGPRRL